MGNNIILSREDYIESGGFDVTGYSIVEDRALFALYSKIKKKVTFTNPFFPSAYTPAVPSFKQFSQQMLRWARGGLTINSNLIAPAILLAVQVISFFCFFSLPIIPGLLTAANIALTWVFIWISFDRTRTTISPWLFPPYILFLMLEVGIFLYASVFRKKIMWKGRNV
jgi:cellulose synthase/poly-beta-1,6-N-acetylglucosamine synthase-like glycosyltransferase